MKLHEFFNGLINFKRDDEACNIKTLKEYRRIMDTVLLPSIGDIELEELRELDVTKIKVEGRKHGEFGEQRGIVAFRQLLKYIRKSGFIPPINWFEIKVPIPPDKEVDWLTPEEWEKVRNAFNLNWIVGIRDRALVEVLWATGMRIGEALSLNRNDIDWDAKEAWIVGGKKPYKKRKVYFTEDSFYWIRQYFLMRNENFDPLFVSLTGQRATPCAVRRTIQEAMKRAGIKKRIHPHIFRSTHATNLLEGGANIKAVQYLLGHESERTTLRHYAAINKSHAKGEHERILDKPLKKTEIDFVKEFVWKKS